MPRNIELKARLNGLSQARLIAQRLATETLPPQHQIDTYFVVPQGRLKLREIGGQEAQLVWYRRPDEQHAKGSDYQIARAPDAATLKTCLAGALGIRVVVEKQREIWLWNNVRIHLDEVVGLGTFLEFEAVLSDTAESELERDAKGHAQLAHLSQQFGLTDADLLAASYSEMLLAAQLR